MSFPIETERLLLRPKTLDDLPFMHGLFSDPAVTRYLGDGKPRSLEKVREGLLAQLEYQRTWGFSLWLACERAGGEPVGDCGLMPLEHGGPEVEIGYRLVPAAWGRGYATEAAAATLRYGFDVAGLDEIVGIAYPENTASRRVMEKIGMTYDGRGVYYEADVVRYVRRRVPPEPVEVVDYDPTWPARFESERRRLVDALGSSAAEVEHVGSTAVPGLPAKPVIDVLVGLREYPLQPAQIGLLEGLGYVYRGELGIPGRQYFRNPPDTRHVHAVLHGSELWRRHVAFRDWLRAHPDDAASYATLKRRLAAEHRDDRARYTEGKASFIEELLQRAAVPGPGEDALPG
jgi:GrpB-like predicted nucleotidyltransferase (UPF0157 family)/RimJ/RimL family protein N-acetyltransferase